MMEGQREKENKAGKNDKAEMANESQQQSCSLLFKHSRSSGEAAAHMTTVQRVSASDWSY